MDDLWEIVDETYILMGYHNVRDAPFQMIQVDAMFLARSYASHGDHMPCDDLHDAMSHCEPDQ